MKKFHPAFIVFTILLLVFGFGKIVAIYLLALVVHEFAHAIVARKLGYHLKDFFLMPYGACLTYQEIFFEDDELKIAIAGPIASFLTGLLTISLWWIFPSSYYFTSEFVMANFALAIFNLLPAFPLDGARVAICLLGQKISRKKALKLTVIFNYLFSSFFLVLFIISCFIAVNYNLVIIAIFLFLGSLDGIFQGKYFPIYKIDKKDKLKRGMDVKILSLSSDIKLYKALKKISLLKYNFFIIVFENGATKLLTEDALKRIFENYNLNLTFNDLGFLFGLSK